MNGQKIEMTPDIRRREVKQLGPFSIRQLVYFAIAAAYGIPLFFILPFNIMWRIIATAILVSPMIIFAIRKFDKTPAETVLFRTINTYFKGKPQRKYKIEHLYAAEFKEVLKERPVEKASRKRSKTYKGYN